MEKVVALVLCALACFVLSLSGLVRATGGGDRSGVPRYLRATSYTSDEPRLPGFNDVRPNGWSVVEDTLLEQMPEMPGAPDISLAARGRPAAPSEHQRMHKEAPELDSLARGMSATPPEYRLTFKSAPGLDAVRENVLRESDY